MILFWILFSFLHVLGKYTTLKFNFSGSNGYEKGQSEETLFFYNCNHTKLCMLNNRQYVESVAFLYNKHCGIVAKKIVKEGDLKRIHDRAFVAPPLTLPILSHPVCLGCIFVVFLVFFFLKPKIKWAWSTLLTACLRYGGGRVFFKGVRPQFLGMGPLLRVVEDRS